MPKSTIHTISQKLLEKHPILDPSTLYFILDNYFNTVKEGITGLKDTEVTMLFGEFKVRPKKIETKQIYFETIINNPDSKPDNVQRIKELQERLNFLAKKRRDHIANRGKVIERTGKKLKRPKKNEIIDGIERTLEQRKEQDLLNKYNKYKEDPSL